MFLTALPSLFMKGPIIIAGFGRSGTTWLSDIVSKALGGLVLFEPFHPIVCELATSLIYSTNPANAEVISTQWEQHQSGPCPNRWLIRNHLRSPIDEVPEPYIQNIWDKSPILGYKTIRTNHLLAPSLEAFRDARLIYIIRHPLAVLASINNRPRFWEEFDWQWHYQKFVSELKESELEREEKDHWIKKERTLNSKNERIIFMWTVSQEIALAQSRSCGAHVLAYEDLYQRPYEETKNMLTFLGHSDRTIHPSYLFEPSLTTHRTFHNSNTGKMTESSSLPRIFWESSINVAEESHLLDLISELNPTSPEVLRYLGVSS